MKSSFEYAALAPVVILLTAGVFGVVIEAFIPRVYRRTAQLFLVLGSLVVSLAYVIISATKALPGGADQNGGQTHGLRQLAASGAAAIDGAGLFLQGTIILVAIVSVFLIAERQVDPQGDAFAARSSTLPGSEDERQFTAQ